MAVRSQVSLMGTGLAYARSVCDTKAALQRQLQLVALYRCYTPMPLVGTT